MCTKDSLAQDLVENGTSFMFNKFGRTVPSLLGNYKLVQLLNSKPFSLTYLGSPVCKQSLTPDDLVILRVFSLHELRRNSFLRYKIERRCLVLSLLAHHRSSVKKTEKAELVHFIQSYPAFRSGSDIFLVDKFYPGGSLLDVLLSVKKDSQNGKSIPLFRIRAWIRQLVLSVKFLHEDLHLAHQKLCLQHIYIQNADEICVGGFEGCRVIDGNHQVANEEYIFSCSLDSSYLDHYSPPELMMGKTYDPEKVDIWAIGVIVFSLLLQSYPFCRNSKLSKMVPGSRIWSLPGAEDMPYMELKDGILDSSAKHLLKGLLDENPTTRFSLSDVLSHPFFMQD